jgi:drug/metabolite transporter (DMT)-like permease
MSANDNAIAWPTVTHLATTRSAASAGLGYGGLGVLVFSLSFPATKAAVGGLDPWFVAFGRAAVAGVLSLAYLWHVRAPRPTREHVKRLFVVVGGVVIGFPLLSSLALQVDTSAHGAVVIGLLPAATAVAAVLRAHERPSLAFWLAAAAGLVAVLVFLGAQGMSGVGRGDVLLLVAVAVCGLGYAEGGALSRELGGPVTICWALVLAMPVTVVVATLSAAHSGLHAGASAWLGFAYVSVFSMFLGFFTWYAGLARGGVARIGQVQLAQPVLTLGWSALLLGEVIGMSEVLAALAVLVCVAVTQRVR